MKQKDILLIAIVVIVSGAFSIVITKMLFAVPKNRQEKIEVVESISSEFNSPSKVYFNANSLDPTQLIKIGDNNNNDPFKQQ